MRSFLITIVLAAAWLIPDARAEVVISEFMADNAATIADDFGQFSDWIELHNPSAEPVDLTLWSLTDNPANLTKWRFPAISLAPGEFRIVWASNRNLRDPSAPLHTNFALSKDGEFLALVHPDGSTIEHAFAPAFPPLATDASWGLRFESTTHVARGHSFSYRVPTGPTTPGPDWASPAFNASGWATGPSGLGFGIRIPGITVDHVFKNGSMSGLDDAINLVNQPPGSPLIASSATVVLPVLNLLGEGGDGRYGSNFPPPAGIGDNYAIRATGFLRIATPGTYTFGLNSDDGGRIRINGSNVMVDPNFHGAQDNFGTITLGAGWHEFEVIMFEGGGGDCVEFFAAPGSRNSFDASVFRLVGDVAGGGLPVATLPAGSGGLIGTNLQSAMSGRNGAFFRTAPTGTPGAATSLTLVMRSKDGFIAALNGIEIARDNAPASADWDSAATTPRPTEGALIRRAFNVTAALESLSSPDSVLAIHGLRAGAEDDSGFLVLPELISGRIHPERGPVLFAGDRATPGWINGQPSSLGPVAEVSFSRPRGIFTKPFVLTLSTTTPGASIRYTTDGSTPSPTRGILYTAPFNISATTVIRAVAYKQDFDTAPVLTHSFLFPADIIRQSANGSPPPGWPSSSGTSQVLDFGMDPDIVNAANPAVGGPAQVTAALLALPSVLITTDLPNLLNINGSRGIYANPYDRGITAERPASLEWIHPPTQDHPNGTSEFQINAGLRIRGGFSRSTDNPKHAFRFLFRSDYGTAKLHYPLFGDAGASVFDKIDFRTAQNYSWSFQNDDRNTFLREETSRQAFLDMGQPGSRVRYIHLYINGQYFGLFNLDERTEADFAATYFGGSKDDHDVIKAEQEAGYVTNVVDGDINAWRSLWDLGKIHRNSPTNANYFRMQGLAADGVTPTADPVLLDPDNLIDYLLLTFWMGNLDGATSAFLGDNRANNWSGTRRRVGNPGQGFRFFVHDFEHSMLNVNENRTGPFTDANEADFAFSNPMFLHQDLTSNAEYRMRWADRVHRHLFNNGALSNEAWQQRVDAFAAVVDSAIIAESARWGDAKNPVPKTRLTWLNATREIRDYLPQRGPIVLTQLRARNLYPAIDAPMFSPNGGSLPIGSEIIATGPSVGTLYYMDDGSDPRAVGGSIRSGAKVYTPPITTDTLIPWSASGWRYRADGANLGTAWRNPGYNDAAWAVGTAEIGYGDGDESTVIPTPPNPKPATVYFRRTFNVANAADLRSLTLTAEYDDAYAVYLNGVRVAGNLPIDPAFNYYSGNPIEDTIETTTLTPESLVTGQNTLAIEVHQANATSSDLSMNLSLTAVRQTGAGPLVLDEYGRRTLRMRARSGATWSALQESTYEVGLTPPTPANLVLSELSFHPPAPHGEAEFIELLNASAALAINLSAARFTHGIDFTFPPDTVLPPGQRILIVRNETAFTALYGGGFPIAGVFENDTALSNDGERLRLVAPDGTPLLDFTYGVGPPWPTATSGGGRTMILIDPAAPDLAASWRPSATHLGNPNASDAIPLAPGQDPVAYALAMPPPTFDPATATYSATRILGADDLVLTPEWSGNLIDWHTSGLTPGVETLGESNTSILRWTFDPRPSGPVFLRLRLSPKP